MRAGNLQDKQKEIAFFNAHAEGAEYDVLTPNANCSLVGTTISGIAAVAALSQNYPKARLIFSGLSATDPADELLKIFAQLGCDPTRIYMELRPRATSEGALYAAASLKPKRSEGGCWSLQPFICRWLSDDFELPDFKCCRIR
jgi:hypothetical protein